MKVITIKQPHAELILRGLKTIALMNWTSLFRGEVLIYAAQNPDEEEMKRFGFDYLPTGRIVGRAKLIEVKRYWNEREHWLDRERHLADSFVGSHGFVFEDVERIDFLVSEVKEGYPKRHNHHDEFELNEMHRFQRG